MSDTLYESYDTGDDTTKGAIFGPGWRGQTFTPAISHTITSVKVKIFRTGSPGTVNFGVYATSAGKPTGATLCTGTLDGNSLPTTTTTLTEVALSGALLTAGTMYAIVFSAPSGANSSNAISLRVKAAGTYAGGSYIFSSNSGSSWSTDAGDIVFDEYGIPATGAVAKIAGLTKAAVSKVAGVAVASISKVLGVTN